MRIVQGAHPRLHHGQGGHGGIQAGEGGVSGQVRLARRCVPESRDLRADSEHVLPGNP